MAAERPSKLFEKRD